MIKIKKLFNILVIFALFVQSQSSLGELLCADEKCEGKISLAKTTNKYAPHQDGVLAFKAGAEVIVKSKSSVYWGVEIDGKDGYAPKIFIQEHKVITPEKKLIPGNPRNLPPTSTKLKSSQKTSPEAEATNTAPLKDMLKNAKIISDKGKHENLREEIIPAPTQKTVDGTTIPNFGFHEDASKIGNIVDSEKQEEDKNKDKKNEEESKDIVEEQIALETNIPSKVLNHNVTQTDSSNLNNPDLNSNSEVQNNTEIVLNNQEEVKDQQHISKNIVSKENAFPSSDDSTTISEAQTLKNTEKVEENENSQTEIVSETIEISNSSKVEVISDAAKNVSQENLKEEPKSEDVSDKQSASMPLRGSENTESSSSQNPDNSVKQQAPPENPKLTTSMQEATLSDPNLTNVNFAPNPTRPFFVARTNQAQVPQQFPYTAPTPNLQQINDPDSTNSINTNQPNIDLQPTVPTVNEPSSPNTINANSQMHNPIYPNIMKDQTSADQNSVNPILPQEQLNSSPKSESDSIKDDSRTVVEDMPANIASSNETQSEKVTPTTVSQIENNSSKPNPQDPKLEHANSSTSANFDQNSVSSVNTNLAQEQLNSPARTETNSIKIESYTEVEDVPAKTQSKIETQTTDLENQDSDSKTKAQAEVAVERNLTFDQTNASSSENFDQNSGNTENSETTLNKNASSVNTTLAQEHLISPPTTDTNSIKPESKPEVEDVPANQASANEAQSEKETRTTNFQNQDNDSKTNAQAEVTVEPNSTFEHKSTSTSANFDANSGNTENSETLLSKNPVSSEPLTGDKTLSDSSSKQDDLLILKTNSNNNNIDLMQQQSPEALESVTNLPIIPKETENIQEEKPNINYAGENIVNSGVISSQFSNEPVPFVTKEVTETIAAEVEQNEQIETTNGNNLSTEDETATPPVPTEPDVYDTNDMTVFDVVTPNPKTSDTLPKEVQPLPIQQQPDGLFHTILTAVKGFLPSQESPQSSEVSDELYKIFNPKKEALRLNKKPMEDEYCEKEENCVRSQLPLFHQIDAHPEEKVLLIDSLYDRILELFDVLCCMMISATATLLFIFGYYCISQCRKEHQLIAKLNVVERSLMASTKEASILKNDLGETCEKLASIENKSFGSNDMVIAIKKELETCEEEKIKLQNQVVSLEKELENAAEAGLELNKIVSELLNNQSGDESIISSVEDLQRQLNEQQHTILEINAVLADKSRENSELQLMLAEQNAKFVGEIASLQQDNDELESEKNVLKSSIEEMKAEFDLDITKALEGKNAEIKRLQADIIALRTKCEEERRKWQTSTAKIEALENCLKAVKRDPNIKVSQIIDVANVQAELLDVERQRLSLKEQLETEADARKLLEVQVKSFSEEIEKLKHDFHQSEKDKLEAQTRLEVLSNYFKDKENQLQKELSLKETMWLQQQGETTSTVDRLTNMQEEIQTLKSQNDSLRAEIEAQLAAHKAQIGTLENRAHETWLSARQSERKYEEARTEATALRRKLTSLASGNLTKENLDLNIPLTDLNNAPSPVHMDLPASPMLAHLPPPPFIPPPFMGPPPPHFMGMPPFMPPGEMRPPPMGRLMSPPPPSSGAHMHRYSPIDDDEDEDEIHENSRGHWRDTYSPPRNPYRYSPDRYSYNPDLISNYDTETDFSPPPSPRGRSHRSGSRSGSYKAYSPPPQSGSNQSKDRPKKNSKGQLSSGSDKSYDSWKGKSKATV